MFVYRTQNVLVRVASFPKLLPIRCYRVLGIETSCDDTAAGVVTDEPTPTILSDVRESQLPRHNRLFGGVSPSVAKSWHSNAIESVVNSCIQKSGLSFESLDAIAVSTRPGLVPCLRIGADYALELCKKYNKPLIKVHHMRAHALTIGLTEKIDFPFLCLLASGGHCLLLLVQNVDKFAILGQMMHQPAPGEALDKIARRLKLKNINQEFEAMSGGAAIEKLAAECDVENGHLAFKLNFKNNRDCDFDFTPLRLNTERYIEREEVEQGVKGPELINNLPVLCASVQHAAFRQLAKKTQRAIEICDSKGWMPEGAARNLVLSGGVACNGYFRNGLAYVLSHYDYELKCPEPKFCSDNGVMIAWNGLEMLRNGSEDVLDCEDLRDLKSIWCDHRESIGEDWRNEVKKMRWKTQKIQLDKQTWY